jgi:hypothetical protein
MLRPRAHHRVGPDSPRRRPDRAASAQEDCGGRPPPPGAGSLRADGSGPLGRTGPRRAGPGGPAALSPGPADPLGATGGRTRRGGTDQPGGRRPAVHKPEDRRGQPGPHLPQARGAFPRRARCSARHHEIHRAPSPADIGKHPIPSSPRGAKLVPCLGATGQGATWSSATGPR